MDTVMRRFSKFNTEIEPVRIRVSLVILSNIASTSKVISAYENLALIKLVNFIALALRYTK